MTATVSAPDRLDERARVSAAHAGHPLRAVLRRGLRDQRHAPLTWGLPLGASCALIVGMYPSIQGSLDEMMKNYPQTLKDAFGINELNSVEAYLHAEMFSLIVPLAVAFFAVRAVSRSISVAEERGYLDTTLTAPLSRRDLTIGSFGVTAIALVGVLFTVFALTMLAGGAVGARISATKVAAGVASVWPLAIFSAGLAMLIAGFMHRAAPVTAVSAGTLLGMYVVDLVGRVAHPMEPFRVISVFKYYGAGLTNGIDPAAFAGVTLAGVVLAVAGAQLFERRDVLA